MTTNWINWSTKEALYAECNDMIFNFYIHEHHLMLFTSFFWQTEKVKWNFRHIQDWFRGFFFSSSSPSDLQHLSSQKLLFKSCTVMKPFFAWIHLINWLLCLYMPGQMNVIGLLSWSIFSKSDRETMNIPQLHYPVKGTKSLFKILNTPSKCSLMFVYKTFGIVSLESRI